MRFSNTIWSILVLFLVVGGFYLGRYLYFKPAVSKGDKAPVFTASLIDGSPFSLNDLEGNYVLLDFWGSWCGPCVKQFKDLRSLHRKYHGNGFYIVSVGVESDVQRWARTIERAGLNWPHHIGQMELFDSEIARQYGVREIPTKILVDREGKVAMVNPTFDQIRDILVSELSGI